jgi:septal ring factor EnvC (AmiA/AmiB activator)
MRNKLVLVALLFCAVPAKAEGDDADLGAAQRTRALLEEKLAARERDLSGRVRALYKLTRGGDLSLWLDEDARAELVKWRAAARRMLLRDLEERQLLRDELAAATAAERRLVSEAQASLAGTGPAPGSLERPLGGPLLTTFGLVTDEGTGVRHERAGIEIGVDPHAAAGDPVAVSVADGTVVYAGTVRGLGTSVVVDHAGTYSIVGNLARAVVTRGQPVSAGSPVGVVAGDRVYLELRRGGRALDPTPLLRANH